MPEHVPHLGPCWVWTGAKQRKGYGKFGMSAGGWTLAHRWAWVNAAGLIPSETPFVLHRCDNPSCVRFEHLFLGDATTNARDMALKGRCNTPTGADHWTRHHPERIARGDRTPPERRARGERNGFAVASDSIVREIRRRHAAREPQSVIASSLGLGRTTVNHIVHRRTWKHVT
jgi:hypothetical protein